MPRHTPPFLPQDIRIVVRRLQEGMNYEGLTWFDNREAYKAVLQARDGMNAPWTDIPVVVEE